MTSDDTSSHLHTDEDLERARNNPLLTLGLDDPYEGMFRIRFVNDDILALHLGSTDAARSAAADLTRLCRYDSVLERYSSTDGWAELDPEGP